MHPLVCPFRADRHVPGVSRNTGLGTALHAYGLFSGKYRRNGGIQTRFHPIRAYLHLGRGSGPDGCVWEGVLPCPDFSKYF